MSNVLNYFSGTNTAFGFKSFYHNIISKNEANKIIYLKGGPGTGKSSLIKNIGKLFCDKGYGVEYHHCSSDVNSLDGVVIKDLGFCIMDATFPHTMDPSYPGVIEEIKNLGEYWNSKMLRSNRDKIKGIVDAISLSYKEAYSHFNLANHFWEKIKDLNSKNRNNLKYNLLLKDIDLKILNNIPYGVAEERQTFVSSITYEGVISYIEEKILNFDNVYVLQGYQGEGKEDIMDYIYKRLLLKDCVMEVYFNPLNPNFIEHIVLPHLKTAFVCESEFIDLNFKGDFLIGDSIQKPAEFSSYQKEFYRANLYEFINLAKLQLKKSSVMHHELEDIYISAMNFKEVDRIYNEIIDDILN